jgi:hypothetical protein
MFRLFKIYLHKYGIKELTDILDILEYIKKYKIDPYRAHNQVYIETVTGNIISYTKELKNINNTNLIENYVTVKPITMDSLVYISLDQWFTDGVHMVDDAQDAYLKWIDEVIIILTEYQLLLKNPHTGKISGNSIKIRPYIINIEKIVGIIFKQCVT